MHVYNASINIMSRGLNAYRSRSPTRNGDDARAAAAYNAILAVDYRALKVSVVEIYGEMI
jgi:hypothetical protein